ncbi:MAG: hypothetical protein QF718_03735 [Phycisphaerales bacterium]|jgi:tetratricopeptide (TPR) repeat protein|nr:hypothetical protein [Phycisphaerales bacterium]
MKQWMIVGVLLFCTGCGGPTKAGLEARANAHKRMDSVNADLGAQQARQQFEVGQLDKAFDTINAAIARYDEKGNYHLLRGRILLEQHRLDAAFRALTKATVYASELAEPHYFLGVLHQRWGEDEKALEEYKLAMENDSTHPQYLLATAETHVALSQHEEAIELLTNSNQEFQHHPSVSSLLGQIYLSQGQPDVAAAWFEDSRLLGSDSVEVLASLATTQFQAGSYADCLHSLTMIALDQDTLSPTLNRMRGKCLVATGRHIEGRDICLKVTRETPDDAGAWIDLGYIAWKMEDYNRLSVCGLQVSQLAPSLPEGALFEGIAAIHSGNELLAKEKLAYLQSDNDILGVDELLKLYAKYTKIAAETPITPNVTAKKVEDGAEQHPEKLVEGSQPIVGVTHDSPLAP